MPTVYDVITSRIVESLEKGVAPWRKPWKGNEGAPRNGITKKAYRGINAFLTNAIGYSNPNWLTYKQCALFDGCIKKGESGLPIVYWQIGHKKDKETGEVRKTFILRYYTVFNVQQCENLPQAFYPEAAGDGDHQPFQIVEACQAILGGMPVNSPRIGHGYDRACYSPSLDVVRMPEPQAFESPEAYYGVLFHELAHSTGHVSRLNREGIANVGAFGSPDYSKEELIAEMASAFLCGSAGIDTPALQGNTASYLASWVKVLKGDSQLVLHAASAAQKAADWVLNRSFDNGDQW